MKKRSISSLVLEAVVKILLISAALAAALLGMAYLSGHPVIWYKV